MAWGSPPDRRPEGDDLSEQFLGQLGGEEIFQEPLVAAGPDRSGRVARAERSQSDQLVRRAERRGLGLCPGNPFNFAST